ncbi:MAG: Bax inhibitor-1 family protein [Lachnospiraceae bacterium]|nr:Bax inhibitor-1 family protein [Lachnospiraceae bacterium]
MASILSSKEIREQRLKQVISEDQLISRRTYNLILGGVTLYGLVINAVLCAYASDFALSINPIALIIGYFILCMAGTFIARGSKSAIISFLGYNLIVVPLGLVLSIVVSQYGGINMPVVQQAFVLTAGITAIMTAASVTFPNFFSKIGGVLFIALAGLLIVGFIQMFLRSDGILFSVAGAGIFSLYIGYDMYRSQQFSPTADNAVDCAIDLYLDIINLFIHLLRILGRSDD